MTTSPKTRHWTRLEYDRLIESGVFRPGESLELLGGQLVVSEPQGSEHYAAILLVEEGLRNALGPGWLARAQGPIALDDESEPEPDVTAVPGRARDYRRAHPRRPALVVEIADSSLAHDRAYKGSLYARAQIEDYWIVNLIDRVLEVHRQPRPDPGAPFGWSYASKEVLPPESSVVPIAVVSSRIVVRDLLP